MELYATFLSYVALDIICSTNVSYKKDPEKSENFIDPRKEIVFVKPGSMRKKVKKKKKKKESKVRLLKI